jgi:protease-4
MIPATTGVDPLLVERNVAPMLTKLTTIALLIIGYAALGACGPVTFVVGTSAGDQALQTSVVEHDTKWRGDRVVIIDVSGLIINAHKPGLLQAGENPVSLLHEQLEKARTDTRVKAVILRLNTPGGTVTASDAMYRQVLRFRRRCGKPVVALMMDVAASGGYYLACATDEIVAYPSTITGSIGVIMQTFSFKSAMSKIGITADAITSGANKDTGSPFTVLTPEKRAILQGLVDDFYHRFTEVVRAARPGIAPEDFERVTDGRIFSGNQAAKVGLVDRLGDLQVAFARARKLAEITSADLVIYHRPLEYVGSPYARTPAPGGTSGGTQINLAQINLNYTVADAPVGFFYLWQVNLP